MSDGSVVSVEFCVNSSGQIYVRNVGPEPFALGDNSRYLRGGTTYIIQ